MKYFVSQMTVFMANRGNKRNMRVVVRFTLGVIALITLYSGLFHLIMLAENQHYSLVTGLYWTLTVMSTLGFGDITFTSDLGKVFSIVVLFSGIIFFLIMLPFTFIHFIYQPWLEAQNQSKVPVGLPEGVKNHVLLVGTDDMARNIQTRLTRYNIPCWMITPDPVEAGDIFDRGRKVLRGELDIADTYEAARVRDAAMVVALRDDLKNTNIAATVSEVAPETLLASCARNENSIDILRFAGCRHVFHFTHMLGEGIGRRVFAGRTESNIIARFEELCIAEVPARSTILLGKNLIELNLRGRLGINVVGIWQGTRFTGTTPTTVIGPDAVLMLAGTADRLDEFDRTCIIHQEGEAENPVLILGGGSVGKEIVSTLERRMVPFRLVDKNAAMIKPDDERYILGDAEDISVLRKAGIDQVDSVVITTHNDDLNIYLTLYCRKLRPDAQIISRCNLSRNINSLYKAGANLVMALSSVASNAVINLLTPDSVYMLTEGLNIFRVSMPAALIGTTLRTSDIRRNTQCNVVGMRRNSQMVVGLDPDEPFVAGDELVLVGTTEAELEFMKKYPNEADSKA
ncbi:NAD-binding protein [Desulfovibrio sp. OttesenSCG-928-C06]|nr:NAD-binding protein [Desulfovibrio sp. OttesenSCG-928-C06]